MIDRAIWNGRRDSDSAGDTRRLHEVVAPFDRGAAGGAAIIGFACDEGVRRNHGRIGAAQGPDAIRRALANLPAQAIETLFDAGNIACADGDLALAQSRLAERVEQVLARQIFPLILGGGHEVAFGTFGGIARHLGDALKSGRLLIVNFDAHFDLREAEQATSGTPFQQIAEWCRQAGVEFHYLCYGISRCSNTPALFARAGQLGVRYWLDSELAHEDFSKVDTELRGWLAEASHVYLTIDLDVLPAEKAPGVSAPAAFGVALDTVERLVQTIKQSGKLLAADIAECNPIHDRDGLTARVAARLAHGLLQGLSNR